MLLRPSERQFRAARTRVKMFVVPSFQPSSRTYFTQILITASTLFEAVEPRAAWRQLFRAVRQEILSTETTQEAGHSRPKLIGIHLPSWLQCIDLFVFVLQTFRVDEEEVQGIHLPLIFCALVEKLEVVINLTIVLFSFF